MSKQFTKTLDRHLQAAWEQGFREGAHQATIHERKQVHEKKLIQRVKHALKRGAR